MKFVVNLIELWRGLDSRNRLRSGYVVIGLLAASLAWGALAAKTAELERKQNAREAVLKELLPLKVAYRSARLTSDQLAGRLIGIRPDDTPARIIEETGIRGKGVKITPLKGEERAGVVEDAADVRMEGLTGNEVFNLIYRLEKGSRPLLLKKVNLRVRFDDPSRFDLAMNIALLKPVPGPAK
jgi:general secretion pathway protein M